MMNHSKCLGCGALKQTDNENEIGYVKDLSHEYCLSCYNLLNYGKSFGHFNPRSYPTIKKDSLVLIIQSVMQLDMLFSQPITKIQNDAKYIYVINQMDLLPVSTNIDFLYDNILKKAKENNIIFDDIVFMSAINNSDINNLKEYLKVRMEKDVYLFGFQNSGKTTIFKGLTNNKTALNINKSGLTQEIITGELFNKMIIDMPGTYIKGYLSDFFEYDKYKKILYTKKIKPKVYQVKKTQKLVINDFIMIEYKTNSTVNTIIYASEFTQITKYNNENKNDYLDESIDFTTVNFKINNDNMQISVADFLLIKIKTKCNVSIKLPKKMHISIMEAMFK